MKCGGSQSLILNIFPQVFSNWLVLLNDILSLNVSFIDIIPVFLLSMLQYWMQLKCLMANNCFTYFTFIFKDYA